VPFFVRQLPSAGDAMAVLLPSFCVTIPLVDVMSSTELAFGVTVPMPTWANTFVVNIKKNNMLTCNTF
jgi:hypothetical protein